MDIKKESHSAGMHCKYTVVDVTPRLGSSSQPVGGENFLFSSTYLLFTKYTCWFDGFLTV